MIGRRGVCAGCGLLAGLGPTRPPAQGWIEAQSKFAEDRLQAHGDRQAVGRPGPFTPDELVAARRSFQAGIIGVFQEDLLARLPPAKRAQLGDVRLELPDAAPIGPGTDPGFVLNVYADPARRRVVLPLRTVLWLDQYAGLTAHLERRRSLTAQLEQHRRCEGGLTLCLLYAGMLATQPPGGERPPGPLAAFGLTDAIYDDRYVKDVTGKLLDTTVFFLLAHELGHLAQGHRGGLTGAASQRQEREADAYALDVMAHIGIFPLGLAMFFTAAAMLENGQNTHPLSGNRVVAVAEALEARPHAFVDRAERNPEAWVPRLRSLAAQVRAAVPLVDDPTMRASILATGRGVSFSRLPQVMGHFCPG